MAAIWYMLWVSVERAPGSQAVDDAWEPRGGEVAARVSDAVALRDLGQDWIVTKVGA
jgi:hypothetical protein